MFKFTSKPIQMAENNGAITIVCEDGSIWRWLQGCDGPSQIAEWEKPVRKQPATKAVKLKPSTYTPEFDYFWKIWSENIMNTGNKQNSFKGFQLLSKDEKTALVYSVPLYARTEPRDKHRFLKRCETYINQKHFESMGSFESVMPSMSDAKWSVNIINPENGIMDSARCQIEKFGMDKDLAWKLINEE